METETDRRLITHTKTKSTTTTTTTTTLNATPYGMVTVGDNWMHHMQHMVEAYLDPATVKNVRADDLEAIVDPFLKTRVIFRVWMYACRIPEARVKRTMAIHEASKFRSAEWWLPVEYIEKAIEAHPNEATRLRTGVRMRNVKNVWIKRDHEAAEMDMVLVRERARCSRVETSLATAVRQREFAEHQRDERQREIDELKQDISRKDDVIQRLFREVSRLRTILFGGSWFVPKGIISSDDDDDE